VTILQRLKEETRPVHDKLESELDLLKDDFTKNNYIDVLKKFYGFYLPLEKTLTLYPERSKISKLTDDLKSLGIHNLSLVPHCEKLPAILNESFEWGVRYVLEGSTLGGQVLRKHYEEKFNLSQENGISFFSGYGKETMPMWKKFQQDLLTFSESKNCSTDYVILGANTTFRLLNDWLIRTI
jgi:heme oxygenase